MAVAWQRHSYLKELVAHTMCSSVVFGTKMGIGIHRVHIFEVYRSGPWPLNNVVVLLSFFNRDPAEI